MDYTYKDVLLFIDGNWLPAQGGKTIAVIDPATEEQIGVVSCAEREDLDAALDAVSRGFNVWRHTSAFERAKIMRKAADLLRERAPYIAWLMTREQGKPLAQSTAEILGAADTIEWFAEEGRRTYGQVIPARSPNITQMTVKLPVGPVAAFTPWNFPINQLVRKLSAALAAGCSLIVKAPEETPASPAELVRCFVDAGIPAGVVNLVYGVPTVISEYLISHPVIRKVTFTGSTVVGKLLASLAGQHMKRATMELGGHAPVVIAEDADLDQAVSLMSAYKFRNAGQVCISPSRFLVHERVADRFLEGFTAAAKAIKVGNGLDEDTSMGPLANERRILALEAMVADALECGARLTTGGHRIGNNGYFFEPTILADVPVSAKIMNDEPFGPAVVINRFTDLDEAIAEANRLPYGLAAYAFTRSEKTATRLSMEVESGMMTINHLGFSLPEVPFGGIKDSGYGTEGGSEAIAAYLETRFITRV
ncbi:Alpha-ketoglutaric semialdehyde dehydrogenase 1 (plasmid) [Caballeronia sp. SBC1]|uniref:NAD-dependent succinate-semialdehyde dehydrogenase n=1 Tax=unclassified Caballeronia TaxID=2646786 RepID=UPI0013E1A556|nr:MULTISPECIES: NAD-dependent succinate-semialdehyde dehydrogenase [unclassified Caballeronia]QIE26622.1 Alpha-ketoglutaric semialdehyde dehydrogenase 1 [Caballeronia sp. SBC2]QIN64062.1 Alpha-ketoglutaric semialdehyde dehydrogenase 1 [Caballeronia sp. SBC1]